MKSRFLVFLILMVFALTSSAISPYLKLAETSKSVNEVAASLQTFLAGNNYELLGSYPVGNDKNKKVIVFTSENIKAIALTYEDRGGLAVAQKFGIFHSNGITQISLLNPEYIFRAYFQDGYKKNESALNKITTDLKSALKKQGYSFQPFGGVVAMLMWMICRNISI